MRLVIPILLLPLVVPLVLAVSLSRNGSNLSWRNVVVTPGPVTPAPRFDEGRSTQAGWRVHPVPGRNATGVLRANSAEVEPREGCPSNPSLMQPLNIQNCRFDW